MALGTVALACGGSAFTTDDNGKGGSSSNGGSDVAEGGRGGLASHAGRNSAGSLSSGGKTAVAGTSSVGGVVGVGGLISAGGDLSIGGDLVTGGTQPVAGTTSAAGTAGTGPDPVDKVCPTEQPTKGGSCSNGLVCTYTSDVRPSCRPVAKCENSKWSITKTDCDALAACPALQVNAKCDAQTAQPCMLNTTEGIYCVCTGCDGATGNCNGEPVWACAAGSGGSTCPKLPPNKGQMCTGEQQCGYGSCTTANSLSTRCDGSIWNWDLSACPL
jgi:hypothetical protein